jgi:hypothetical protein
MIIAGPSGCGKTVFVETLLKCPDMFSTEFTEIIWCYSIEQPIYNNIQARFIKGLPDENEFDGSPKLVILDDLMQESNEKVSKLFTRVSHHKNVSVIFITQNIFHQQKNSRDKNINAHYLVMFKNPRDYSQITCLSRQIDPCRPKIIEQAFREATQKPHGYLLFDFKQSTPDIMRLRSDIFSQTPKLYGVSPQHVTEYCQTLGEVHEPKRVNEQGEISDSIMKQNNFALKQAEICDPDEIACVPFEFKKNFNFLRSACQASDKTYKAVLKHSRPCEIEVLGRCAEHILNGDFPVAEDEKKRLKKVELKNLANSKYPVHKKLDLLVQNGGTLLHDLINPFRAAIADGKFRI